MARRRRRRRSPGLDLVVVGLAVVAAALLVGTHLVRTEASGRGRVVGSPRVREAPPPREETGPDVDAIARAVAGDARSPEAPAASALVATAPPPVRTAARQGTPLAAIVIDDCGQRLDLMEVAVRSRTPLTFAVIPHLPHSRASAELAYSAGHEVILHQPMEAQDDGENPGRGTLRVGMKPQQVARVLEESLGDVPHAVGLNNHMGSRATSDETLMGHVLQAMRRSAPGRGKLYFLDSRTTAETVAFEAARRAGVPAAMRSVFLDNEPDPVAIKVQVERLLALAREHGEAIAIGHLKPDTIAVLEAMLPVVPEQEVRFVFASELAR